MVWYVKDEEILRSVEGIGRKRTYSWLAERAVADPVHRFLVGAELFIVLV